MFQNLREFLLRWGINVVGVLVATQLDHGIFYDNVAGLLVAAFLLGVLNTFLRPVLVVLSLPLVLISLGLFMFVINGLMLYAVGRLVHTFHVLTFWDAFWGALIISIVSLLLNPLVGVRQTGVQYRRGAAPKRRDDGGGGPVIDV